MYTGMIDPVVNEKGYSFYQLLHDTVTAYFTARLLFSRIDSCANMRYSCPGL